MTIATLFSGGGLVEVGATAAGYTPIWSVEYDPAIAEVHRANIPGQCIVKRVQEVDPMTLDRPDHLHASTICTNASVANSNGTEGEEDLSQAEAVCRFLRVLTPDTFTLENVMQYRRFEAYRRILCTLDELGYWTTADVLNAADFGVPQTRKRLIVRAVREGVPPPLPPKTPWIGWYEAIEDLLPTLPESRFAAWQLRRMPQDLMTMLFNGMDMKSTGREMRGRVAAGSAATITADDWRRPSTIPAAFLMEGTSAGDRPPTVRQSAEPAPTVCGGDGGRVHRAYLTDRGPLQLSFIVEGSAAGEDNKFNMPVRAGDEPVFTMRAGQNNPRAFLVDCQNNGNTEGERGLTNRQSAEQGRVVSMTPRALGRFQTLPDWYSLPTGKGANKVACAVIGNGVPPLLMETILRGLI